MSNLKNAPLIYTVGMLGFPAIPSFERFPALFHEALREEYPLPTDFTLQQLSAQFDANGIRLDKSETKSWQYASIEQDWAFVLTDKALYLHTVNYHDFDNFADRFERGVRALFGISEIKIAWVTSLGFRYVDMIVPKAGDRLEDYLENWAIPRDLPNAPVSIEEGVYIAKYKTDIGHLRFQALRNPPFTLPPDLTTPMTIKNEWIRPRPSTDFAIIDTDHAAQVERAFPADPEFLTGKLRELRKVARQVFDSVGTKVAVNFWEGEHVSS